MTDQERIELLEHTIHRMNTQIIYLYGVIQLINTKLNKVTGVSVPVYDFDTLPNANRTKPN